MLVQDLQCLASEPDVLLQAFWFPGPDYIPDDLAEDFAFHMELAELCVREGLVSLEQFSHVRAVDAKLSQMSGPQDPSLWTDEGVRSREEWVTVRELARGALAAMGYTLDPPPPWWKTETVILHG